MGQFVFTTPYPDDRAAWAHTVFKTEKSEVLSIHQSSLPAYDGGPVRIPATRDFRLWSKHGCADAGIYSTFLNSSARVLLRQGRYTETVAMKFLVEDSRVRLGHIFHFENGPLKVGYDCARTSAAGGVSCCVGTYDSGDGWVDSVAFTSGGGGGGRTWRTYGNPCQTSALQTGGRAA